MIGVNLHQVASISAYVHNYQNAPLKLEIQKTDSPFPAEITLFLDDDALTAALAKAINEAVAAHKPAPVELEAAE